MIMIRSFVFVVLLGIVVGSCQQDKKTVIHRTDDYTLVAKEDKCFPLDSETVQLSDYLQLIYMDGKLVFSFINNYDNSIVLYDYGTVKNMGKIKFEQEGSNGVGSITSYLFLNKDSIYLYDSTLR